MALIDGKNASFAAGGFGGLPLVKQIGILIGLAASIALGISVVFWTMEPSYRSLYSDLSSEDSAQILDVLQSQGIPFKLDKSTGSIMVPADEIHSARMKIAAEGLPNGGGSGFEMLNKGNAFGQTQFMQTAKYRQALAGELARTIGGFRDIKSARVHLAIPKESVFVRDKESASASVFVDVYAGRQLSPDVVSAIVHLVSSSIPNLVSTNVTVVDNRGNLLTDGSGSTKFSAASNLLKHREAVEDAYAKKIQDILVPMMGSGKVLARVSADIDFTVQEQTKESFDPTQKVVRSEKTLDEVRNGASGNSTNASGVPGALSNQPPPASTLDAGKQALPNPGATPAALATAGNGDTTKQATRNFEIDKTISHTEKQPGTITRLTVAVVVDDQVTTDPKTKKVTRTPQTKEQIAKITDLVKSAIGFNEKRGDTVNVINSSFAQPEAIEALPETKLWEQAWFFDLLKQGGGAAFVLLLVFGVLRPILKSLATQGQSTATLMAEMAANSNAPQRIISGPNGQPMAPLQSYEDRMQYVQSMAGQDPRRVAQVVKTWVDGNK